MPKLGAMLVKPALKRWQNVWITQKMVVLHSLGVNGVFMIAHGSSKAKEIKTAIEIASDLVGA